MAITTAWRVKRCTNGTKGFTPRASRRVTRFPGRRTSELPLDVPGAVQHADDLGAVLKDVVED